MTQFEIVPSTTRARSRMHPAEEHGPSGVPFYTLPAQTRYPLKTLNVGESFYVPMDYPSMSSLRAQLTRNTDNGAKRFVLVKHKDKCVYEVARVK